MNSAMKILCFIGFCSMLGPGLHGQNKGLVTINQWGQTEWAYTPEERAAAIASGEFKPGNGVILDVDVNYRNNAQNRIFVTVPKFIDGIPATLNLVSKQKHDGNPMLEPYPNWNWHRHGQACGPQRLISVFRTQIDACGRLWVLDTGKIGPQKICSAQIIAFDMQTDTVIRQYDIPDNQVVGLMVTPVVDVRDPDDQCQDTFVYAADVTGFGMVVYDYRNNRSWRVSNKYMFPYPDAGTFTINGESFDLMDGVLGLALSPLRRGADRILYFHALASRTENYVYTSYIRNESIFINNQDASPELFKVFPKKRPSQSAAIAVDRNGILFFSLASETSVLCWNTETDYDPKNFGLLEQNADTLQFASGVKIIENLKGGQELWIVTTRFQKVMNGSINPKEPNFRILGVKLEDFLKGSKCKKTNNSGSSSYGK